nr:DNA gyrase inhibitor YacG [Ferruginivarius sediminum]
MCGKPAAEKYRPFCSRRCADLDLGKWLNGSYRVPTEEPAPEGAGPGDDEA